MALQKIIPTFFVFMLNNYVVQHIGSASVTARFGSFAIFLLLNDSSHDPHFSACQHIETLDGIQKISNFSFHGFSRYSTPNMALQKIILTFYAEQLRCSAYWVCFDDRTIWVFCDFFTPKRFEPRPSFFIMSKYRNSRLNSKNFKFFSPPVFQIIDSKHGSPEDYSDFFFCFCFCFFLFFFFPIEGYAFSAAYFLEDIEQLERNFADMVGGECSCT